MFYIDLDGGYMGVYISKNSLDYTQGLFTCLYGKTTPSKQKDLIWINEMVKGLETQKKESTDSYGTRHIPSE